MTLPELAIHRRVTTLMIIVSLTVLGAVALDRLPMAFMPDIVEPELYVRVPYPNAAPDQIERMIIKPLEETLGSLRGLKTMWSRADAGSAMIRLDFDWSIDMHEARVEVWERIDRVRRDLPDDIEDITVAPNWNAREAEKPILEGRLSSPRDLSESYDLLERKIVRPLQRIPGVAQVRLDGVEPPEVRINLRVEALDHHKIDVRTVANTIRVANADRSIGRISTGARSFTLRSVGAFVDLHELRNLPLRNDGLKLSDVADIVYAQPPLEYGRHLDGDFAIGITVSQESTANTVEVCRQLEARIAKMAEDPELESVKFLVWFSQGKEIEKTLDDLAFTGLFGALLATVVLFGFLRRTSTTAVSVLCIPFSLLVTCGIVWVQGKSLNTLTLLGLIVGIGMLVDNAVVVMENVFRHMEEGADRRTASLIGARQVSTAVIAATTTSVIVFLPLIFNEPSEHSIILEELGMTVCITLVASLFISQTLIPLATSWFIRSKPRERGRITVALEQRYERLMAWNLEHRWLTPLAALIVFGSALFPYERVDKKFEASESELFVQMVYRFSEPLSLEQKEKMVTRVEKELTPHKEEFLARAIYSFWADRFTLTRIYLEEGEANEDNIKRVRNLVRKRLPVIPGVKLEVTEGRRAWRRGGGKRLMFQIVGEDSDVLKDLAAETKDRLGEVEGLVDPFSGAEEGGRELHVELDRQHLSRFGIPGMVPAELVGLTFRGRRLPRYRTPQGEREMRLTLDERESESRTQLENLGVVGDDGTRVPLASIADFTERRGPAYVERDNRLTSVWVGARYSGGTREDAKARVQALMDNTKLPYGYTWTWGRWQVDHEERSQEFVENLVLALLLIFALMAGLFESVLQAIALMIALPFALSGAIWTLYLTGTDFDQPAAIGLLLLIGIVVNNGIVMVEHINMYRREGMPRHEAMLRGGRERLRPILMTAATTLIGLFPMVIQKPSLGGIYYYSIAFVIMGGLVVSTFLTTVLLPTTISLVEDAFGWVFRRAASVTSTPPRPTDTR